MIHPTIRHRVDAVALAAAASFLLGGCGGDPSTLADPGGTNAEVRLVCTSPCTPSPNVGTQNLKVYFYVVDDGQGPQAQGGFRDHVSAAYNVELSGDDKLFFVDQGVPDRMLLREAPNGIYGFGEPYLVDLTSQLTPTRAVTFRLDRAHGSFTSTLTPPPAFTITEPGPAAAYPLSTSDLPITITAAEPSPTFEWLNYDCVDTNGNHSNSGFQGDYDPRSALVQIDDTHWTFDAATYVSKMTFDKGLIRGPITRCDMALQIQARTVGTPDPAFDANSFVTGLQTRTVSFTLE